MKRFALIAVTTVLALGFIAQPAKAIDASAATIQVFGQYISYLKQRTPGLIKDSVPMDGGTLFLKDEQRLDFPADVLQKLFVIANREAAVWKDTLLAEELRTTGPLMIEAVEGLYSGSDLLGYRVTYAQPAYDLDSCQSANINSCHIGKIREAAFVNPDYTHVEVDQAARAQLLF